jgi:hypothetical protein
VSPTLFIEGPNRYFFFSREEPRVHVHVRSPDGAAKFWLEPEIELAKSRGFTHKELRAIEAIIRRRQHEIRDTWETHFEGER